MTSCTDLVHLAQAGLLSSGDGGLGAWVRAVLSAFCRKGRVCVEVWHEARATSLARSWPTQPPWTPEHVQRTFTSTAPSSCCDDAALDVSGEVETDPPGSSRCGASSISSPAELRLKSHACSTGDGGHPGRIVYRLPRSSSSTSTASTPCSLLLIGTAPARDHPRSVAPGAPASRTGRLGLDDRRTYRRYPWHVRPDLLRNGP